MRDRFGPTQRGFTLIELMVVVLIVGLLGAMAVPLYARAIRSGRRAAIVADARLLHRAMMRYHADNGSFPADGKPPAALDPATLAPLSTGGYLKQAESLTSKLQGGQLTLYVAPDVRGNDTQYLAGMVAAQDPSILVLALYTDGVGKYGWLDGVFLVVDGKVVPADQGD